MNVHNVNYPVAFQINNHIQNAHLKRKKRYQKLCNSHNLKTLAILIAKISLSLFLLPLFSSSYRQWVKKSYLELKNSVKVQTPPPKLPQQKEQEPIPHEVEEPQADPLKKFTDAVFLEQEGNRYRQEYGEIKEKVESVAPGPAFGHVYNVPGSCNLWMPGVAVAADYLTKKTGTKGLWVCQTIEAFQRKFDEVINNPEDQRFAFTLPTINSNSLLEPNRAQHKVTLSLEKKGKDVSIALLDSQPIEINFDPNHCNVENLWQGRYSVAELVFRAVLKSSFEGLNTHIYMSTVKRQVSYGCAIFALRDGVEFLRDKDFFQKIKVSNQETLIRPGLKMEYISTLPSAFMVGTQSLSLLNKFQREFPDLADEKFPEKNKKLSECIPKNLVKGAAKEENHYITRKMFKYNNYVLEKLKNTSADELQAIFNASLIS